MAFCNLVQHIKKTGGFKDSSDFSYIDHAVAQFPQHFKLILESAKFLHFDFGFLSTFWCWGIPVRWWEGTLVTIIIPSSLIFPRMDGANTGNEAAAGDGSKGTVDGEA